MEKEFLDAVSIQNSECGSSFLACISFSGSLKTPSFSRYICKWNFNVKNKYGKIGIYLGLLALILAIVNAYADAIYNPDDWFVFDLLVSEHESRNGIPYELEFKPASWFQLTEENLIIFAAVVAWVLSLATIVLSFLAEIKKENNFTSTNAFILGGATMIVLSKWIGFIAFILLFFALIVLRARLKKASYSSASQIII